MIYEENSEVAQDKASETFALIDAHGVATYPEQLAIYEALSLNLSKKHVVEVGCGIGLGAALIARRAASVLATDINSRTVRFASALYGRLGVSFAVHDARKQILGRRWDAVIAVEVIEHVSDYRRVAAALVRTAPEVWLTSPNRQNPALGKKRPHNKNHVHEFTPAEMVGLFPGFQVDIFHWCDGTKKEPLETEVTPLIYRVTRAEE